MPHLPPDSPAWLARLSVLVVDDEPGMRNFLARILGPQCRRIELAADLAEAEDWLAIERFDVIVLDNQLGNERGLDWMAAQPGRQTLPPVILVSAYADLETAIAAMRAGAVDLLLKPFRSAQLVEAVARIAAARAADPAPVPRRPARARMAPAPLIGGSPTMVELRDRIARVADLHASLLVTGPSGSGKDVVVRQIHAQSMRRDRPFIPVSCAVLNAATAEEVLFGVDGPEPGLFLQARGGTLYLDEITRLPDQVQVRLLRVLEDQRFRPAGGGAERQLDVRLMSGSSLAPRDLPAAGLREDLLYRINTLQLSLPPLKDRTEDIPELLAHFIAQLSQSLGLPPVDIPAQSLAKLEGRTWPGNLRELRNLAGRALVLGSFDAALVEADG